MSTNGMINSGTYGLTAVASPTHPCVFKTYKPTAGQGVLPAGMLCAISAGGELIPYDRAGAAPANAVKGVLATEIDTAANVDEAAVTIIHGTVVLDRLVYGQAAAAVTQADIKALEAITIYPQ